MRRALHASALFICFCLVPAQASDTETVTVRAAFDGDSLLLTDGREIRLIGINAPELGKNKQSDQPIARAARERAAQLTRGRTVRLVYDEQRSDRYGRTLAYVTLPDGRDLDEILLEEGYGWYIAISPNVARLSAYRSAEVRARSARRGVWTVTEYEPLSAERVSPQHYGFMRLVGRVTALERHASGVEVVFGSHAHLWIPKDIYQSLPSRPAVGNRVLARGWLAEYKGKARMRITHAAMLEEISP